MTERRSAGAYPPPPECRCGGSGTSLTSSRRREPTRLLPSATPDDGCSGSMDIAEEVLSNHVDPGLDDDERRRVSVYVRPVHRPSRWAWYAIDTEKGETVEYVFECESPTAARRAGWSVSRSSRHA